VDFGPSRTSGRQRKRGASSDEPTGGGWRIVARLSIIAHTCPHACTIQQADLPPCATTPAFEGAPALFPWLGRSASQRKSVPELRKIGDKLRVWRWVSPCRGPLAEVRWVGCSGGGERSPDLADQPSPSSLAYQAAGEFTCHCSEVLPAGSPIGGTGVPVLLWRRGNWTGQWTG
jgi:hypothetical protein